MFKKLNKAFEDIHKVLIMLIKCSDHLDDILEFVEDCQARLREFDAMKQQSIDFLKTDDERFKDADK